MGGNITFYQYDISINVNQENIMVQFYYHLLHGTLQDTATKPYHMGVLNDNTIEADTLVKNYYIYGNTNGTYK